MCIEAGFCGGDVGGASEPGGGVSSHDCVSESRRIEGYVESTSAFGAEISALARVWSIVAKFQVLPTIPWGLQWRFTRCM
jgi:hypothetical protein